MTGSSHEVDYVLGTHDDEVTRLGVQHRVWRPRVLDAWRRAGFQAGQRILDIGSGPGFAALDLAEIVGSAGQVLAVERSRRFLDVLERENEQLRQSLEFKEQLEFCKNVFWAKGSKHEGPYCPACWSTKQIGVPMTMLSDPAFFDCPVCRIRVDTAAPRQR